jgi:hypothetical protein
MLEFILIACCELFLQRTQASPRLPVTIEAVGDVTLRSPDPRLGNQRAPRGVLDARCMRDCVSNEEPITIKQGTRFLMIKILSEGGCIIQFDRRQYTLISCWWLDGFTDHQEDFFRVVPSKPSVPSAALGSTK